MHKRKAAGFSLLEMVIALALVAVFVTAMLPVVRDRYDAKRQAATASQIMAYSHAVDAYVQANSAGLQASAGPSTPVAITAAQLASLLPAGFSFTTPYGQTLTACVTEPSAGQLAPLVVTTGGQALTDLQAVGIAMNITELGGDGGTLDHRNASQLVGGTGFWRVSAATCGASPGLGHVADALFVRYAASTDDALHRHAGGNPALNTMSTALNMGGNDITNARTLTLASGNAINIAGSFLYGDSANLALRAASGNVYIQNSTGSASGNIVQVHNISGDGSSTFTANNISAANTLWAGGKVVTNGDVSAAGAVYASNWLRTYGNTGWYSQSYGGGWYMQDGSWIRAYNNKGIYTAGEIRGGTVHATGSLVSDGVVTITQTAVPHGSCSGTGKLVNANNGSGLLQCDGNSWEPLGGYTGTWHGGPTSTGNYSATNTTGKTMFVAATVAGSGCASYRAYATVNGAMVADAGDYNPSYAKYGSMMFPVQAGATWSIIVAPYSCSTRWYANYFY